MSKKPHGPLSNLYATEVSLNTRISQKVHDRMLLCAGRLGMTRKEIIETAIVEYLKTKENLVELLYCPKCKSVHITLYEQSMFCNNCKYTMCIKKENGKIYYEKP